MPLGLLKALPRIFHIQCEIAYETKCCHHFHLFLAAGAVVVVLKAALAPVVVDQHLEYTKMYFVNKNLSINEDGFFNCYFTILIMIVAYFQKLWGNLIFWVIIRFEKRQYGEICASYLPLPPLGGVSVAIIGQMQFFLSSLDLYGLKLTFFSCKKKEKRKLIIWLWCV